MTVSSTISVFCRDGVFRTVYCHLHGEPTWNGRILHTHYATGQQAEALVEHGDIRCLGPRCDKPAGHTLQNPVDGVTAYYGRDSGFRMDSEAREYRSFREAPSAPGCLAASGRQARLRQAAAGAPASLRRTRWRGFGLPLRSDV
ncbi:hypothetical protein [Shigella sonnei]|uniref:hypothetical protein n=1 Tax=Shigella sonnei TaxID=624 RepID=UPI0006639134|nr:hypothetical protein [Shigella sonnei]CTC07920.1 Uncharacterised protein [Shigella sonnei]